MKEYRDKVKVFRVIKSCLTIDHINVAHKMIENYCKMYNVDFIHSGLCGLFNVHYHFINSKDIEAIK